MPDKVWLCFYYCSPIISSDLVFVDLFLLGIFLFLFFFCGDWNRLPSFCYVRVQCVSFSAFPRNMLDSLSSDFIGFRGSWLPVISSYWFDLLLLRPTGSCGFFIEGSCIFMAKYFMGDMRIVILEHHPVLHNTSCYTQKQRPITGNTHIKVWGWGEMKSYECKEQDRFFNVNTAHWHGANKIWKKFIVLAMTYWDVLRFLLCKK